MKYKNIRSSLYETNAVHEYFTGPNIDLSGPEYFSLSGNIAYGLRNQSWMNFRFQLQKSSDANCPNFMYFRKPFQSQDQKFSFPLLIVTL